VSIMDPAEKGRKAMTGPTLAAASRFKSYSPEHEEKVRQLQVKADPTLEALIRAWGEVITSPVYFGSHLTYHIGKSLKGINYSAEDVGRFSLIMHRFQNQERFVMNFGYDMGFFLSRLVHDCPDKTITIHTGNLEKRLEYLGYDNKKELVVNGDGGDRVGHGMYRGKLVINGDTGFQAGDEMTGGIIIIKGNAGDGVGRCMRGGEIRLEGTYESIGSGIEHGKIYHKEKRIFKK